MPNLLDIDPSIIERNLMLEGLQIGDEDTRSDSSLFNIKPKGPDEVPWKPVRPDPGYVVKLRTEEGDKVFVNVCHTEAIPEPADVSEEALLRMVMHDDVPSFRVPISIGELHIESDKGRNPCSVYDVAVNTKFFRRMETSEVFNTFFLNVSIQALQEKYSLRLDLKSEEPFLMLKNRKVVGTLQVHRIQQREVKKAPGQLIQEIKSEPAEKSSRIEVIGESDECGAEEKSTKKGGINDKSNSSKRAEQNCRRDDSSSGSSLISSLSSETIKSTSSEEFEKGTKESLQTKDSDSLVSQPKRNLSNLDRLASSASSIVPRQDQNTDSANDITRLNVDPALADSDSCPGLICLRRYPESGPPSLLIASVWLDVECSNDFDLEVDERRLRITLRSKKEPWVDISLPYSIDVPRVQACFLTQTQRLMIKMDVEKS